MFSSLGILPRLSGRLYSPLNDCRSIRKASPGWSNEPMWSTASTLNVSPGFPASIGKPNASFFPSQIRAMTFLAPVHPQPTGFGYRIMRILGLLERKTTRGRELAMSHDVLNRRSPWCVVAQEHVSCQHWKSIMSPKGTQLTPKPVTMTLTSAGGLGFFDFVVVKVLADSLISVILGVGEDDLFTMEVSKWNNLCSKRSTLYLRRLNHHRANNPI